jgi:predicted trehalose synthase
VAWAGSALLAAYGAAAGRTAADDTSRRSDEALLRLLLLERAFDDVRVNATARPSWLPLSEAIVWNLIEESPAGAE